MSCKCQSACESNPACAKYPSLARPVRAGVKVTPDNDAAQWDDQARRPTRSLYVGVAGVVRVKFADGRELEQLVNAGPLDWSVVRVMVPSANATPVATNIAALF